MGHDGLREKFHHVPALRPATGNYGQDPFYEPTPAFAVSAVACLPPADRMAYGPFRGIVRGFHTRSRCKSPQAHFKGQEILTDDGALLALTEGSLDQKAMNLVTQPRQDLPLKPGAFASRRGLSATLE